MLLSSIRERQREIAVMRAIGASSLFIFLLIQIEALLIVSAAIILAIFLLTATLHFSITYLAENFGIFINHLVINDPIIAHLGIIIASTFLLGLIPALSAYRLSLHQGLTIKN